MDFKLVLERLLSGFQDKDIRYALTGGFALGLWGGSRSTVDLDFLVHREDMDKVHTLMTGLGYEIHHHSENVSQYVSPLARFGGIDFIHAFRDASQEMLKRAVEKEIFSGSMKVRTMIPEDIIGLKLQAVYNNPKREKVDMADIEMLVSVHKDLDWDLLKVYFTIFQMDGLFEKIKEGARE
ncbi:MAG: nucleotidyl transferase AbiEii/AbiGii toxin family protein [Nitrospirae bacterium]|nr:nucleotidyl transferase AbiEii/AbiGii toxin family protein [Nitrospirota bacterium]